MMLRSLSRAFSSNHTVMFSGTFLLIYFAFSGSLAADIRSKANLPHPFLYFNENEITDLQHRARTTHAEIASRIRAVTHEMAQNPEKYLPPREWSTFSSSWNERYGNDLTVLAFYCVLKPEDSKLRELAILFMDRLENLPNWRVNASLHDDVPVAHSLTGMATAYDFLYSALNDTQRTRFLKKIASVTKELYERSYDRKLWWGNCYLQNHVATNYMAILTGALVVSRHQKVDGETWMSRAHLMLSRNLELLNNVVDGSIDEGVAYGTYTSRSLTQYVFFALRHFRRDFTHNPWFREHLWFIHYTVLPGFKQTVGIGDSNRNWFYGPESQLVFLDSYVLRNGLGNWLARQITVHRDTKPPFAQAKSHVNCMLHTEFLFYNASIVPRAQPNPSLPRLHVFADWGVVTYGGGVATSRRNRSDNPLIWQGTFLSFKCSVLHGRAVNSIVRGRRLHSWIRRLTNFNPGHEHPDQGSFVFAPNGVPFITDTLYAPKYTWLNNALVFGPSLNSACFSPFEGQIGECHGWFNFKTRSAWRAEGEIVSASHEGDMVFTSGEMSQWYRAELGLLSIYRSLVMLTPSVLLVVDHIERKRGGEASIMSAFFHNVDHPFKLNTNSFASISIDGLLHQVHWFNFNLGTKSLVEARTYVTDYKSMKTNYLNVTTPLEAHITRTAYLFLGPGNSIEPAEVLHSHELGLKLLLTVNRVKYLVSIATQHNQPYSRYKFLGFGGFCKVRINNSKTIRFGLDVISKSEVVDLTESPNGVKWPIWSIFPTLCLIFGVSSTFFLFYYQLRHKLIGRNIRKTVFLGLLAIWIILTFVINIDLSLTGPIQMKFTKDNENFEPEETPPLVFYTSLPMAGSEILHYLFKNTSDFFYAGLRESTHKFLNPCGTYSLFLPSNDTAYLRKWLRALSKDPKGFLPNVRKISRKLLPSVRLGNPGWSLKLGWLRKVVGQRMRAIVVVRDPRGWVNFWFREMRADSTLGVEVHKAIDVIRKLKCHNKYLSSFAPEFKELRDATLEYGNKTNGDIISLLAHLWKTQMQATYRANFHLPQESIHYVHFEDLINKPRKTAQRLFQFIGVPLSPRAEHRILTAVKTSQFSLGASREVLGTKAATAWERELTDKEAEQIKEICDDVMIRFRYAFD